MKKTVEAKMREAALDALQKMLDMRLESQGGYPAVIDGNTIPGYVVIADVDHDEAPELTIYKWPTVLAWHREALEYLKDNPEADIVEAMGELSGDFESEFAY